MSNLAHRQDKIQEKRKNTPRREFVMEVASWKSFTLHKKESSISLYVDRIGWLVSHDFFEENRNNLHPENTQWVSFFSSLGFIFSNGLFPWLSHFWGLENCDYASTAYNCKNCYLSFNLSNSENILYSISIKEQTKNVVDSLVVYDQCENIYNSTYIGNSFNIFFSKFIVNSSNIRSSSNLIGCSECIACHDLQNNSYMIDNIQYKKDAYMIKKEIYLSDKIFDAPGVKWNNYGSTNCEGQNIIQSQDIQQGIWIVWVAKWRNLFIVGSNLHNEKIFDTAFAWAGWCVDIYGGADIAKSTQIYNSVGILDSSDVFYSYYLESCSFCLGCIWLKNKSYCILNKQYTKEEWLIKVDEIFAQMEKDGTLGEFFPWSMNPFYFNDTAAYLIDQSFTKEEVTAKWYLRRDEPIKVDIPDGVDTVKVSELDNYEGFVIAREQSDRGNPGKINWIASSLHSSQWQDEVKRHIDPSILKKIIIDEQGNYYRIVKMEYDFLVKHGLPLPRKHRLDRMKENFRLG